jgi:putative peptidoglycan lipid II flippase
MSSILGILVVAILFRSIYHISARSFYAQQDTKTPLYISFLAIGLNIILAIWFTMGLNLGAYGLAWATSIVSVIEVLILFFIMSRRIKGLFDLSFLSAVSRMVVAALVMSIITYISFSTLPLNATDQSFIASFPKFAMIVAFSGFLYLIFSRMLGLQEVKPIIAKIKKLLPNKLK